MAAEATVLNTAPEVQFVRVTPDKVDTLGTLTASWSLADVDGDDTLAQITWMVDGAPVADVDGPILTGEHFDRGQTIEVEIVPFDGDLQGTAVKSSAVVVANSAPSATGATILPENPTEESELTCAPQGWFDLDGDSPNAEVVWYVNGVDVATTPTLSGALFNKGDLVRCKATPFDGEDRGPSVVSGVIGVGNSAPRISGAVLSTTTPKAADDLTYTVSGAVDPDGDDVETLGVWYVDGVETATGTTLPAGSFRRGQEVYVVVSPTDGLLVGEAVESNAATAVNSPPVMTTVVLKPDILYTNDSAFPSVDAVDADGDRITYTKTWLVNGSAISETGSTLDGTVWFDRDDTVQVEIGATDGIDTSTKVRSSVITVLNSPPSTPTIAITPDKPRTAEDLVCRATVPSLDADADTLIQTIVWTRNGATFSGATRTTVDGDTVPGSTTMDGDTFRCTWTVSDGVASASATAEVKVQNWAGPRNFTTCSTSGANGPTQSACDSAYGSTTLKGEVAVSSGIQTWTVPQTGKYRIEAWGAQGAKGTLGSTSGPLGARMRGDFSLTKGEKIKVLVGQMGTAGSYVAGGGGASWITKDDGTPLLVAGGGGGLGYAYTSHSGCDGQSGTTARGAYLYSTSCSSTSTSSGGGGYYMADGYSYYPYYEYYYYYGNGGAGYTGDGRGYYSTKRAYAFKNGGRGGDGSYADGGFGGGGSGDSVYYEYDYYWGTYTYDDSWGGGGGGGYTGGDGGYYVGGGGSSYNTGSSVSNSSSAWAGAGKVTIDLAP
jgi:hypothetical protein